MSNHENAIKKLKEIGKDKALEALKSMLLIRNFEIRGESAYQHGLPLRHI